MLDQGEFAEMFTSSNGEDQIDFGIPNPPFGFKFFMGADTIGATTVGFGRFLHLPVYRSQQARLLIAGLVGLAGLTLKKSL
jgi:hypothetical protein